MGQHISASGSVLLGVDGFEVVSAELVDGEWQLVVQTTATMVGCAGCGVPAKPHGRREVRVRNLPMGGRPVVLCWRKRLWRCHEPACGVRTWTERTPAIGPRAVLTERAHRSHQPADQEGQARRPWLPQLHQLPAAAAAALRRQVADPPPRETAKPPARFGA